MTATRRPLTSWSLSIPPPPTAVLPSGRAIDLDAESREDHLRPTIFQLSTAPGRAGVAVVRISGPDALAAAAALVPARVGGAAPPSPLQLEPRRATLLRLHDPHTRELLDAQALALHFPAPRSFTGEHMVELHIHGSPVVVRGVLAALASLERPSPVWRGRAGLRAARAGEFTRRAFENGKMDLTQVEGLGDLLAADTEAQRRQALQQMDGALGRLYEAWRERMVLGLAHIEAVIDFSADEQDVVEGEILAEVAPALRALRAEIEAHLADGRRGELVRDGLRVAIVGRPNAGKSSLLNVLARRPAAIVSDVPGTTRDVVEVALNLHGWPVLVADTAGLRPAAHAADAIEVEGMRRARAAHRAADLTLLVVDGDAWWRQRSATTAGAASAASAPDEVRALLREVTARDAVAGGAGESRDAGATAPVDLSRVLVVWNKADLWAHGEAARELATACEAAGLRAPVAVSCASEAGVVDLLSALQREIETRCLAGEAPRAAGASAASADGAPPPVITRLRHRQHLEACVALMRRHEQLFHVDLVLATEELRMAARELGALTGRIDVEHLLDIVFRDFCIGK